MSKPSVLVVAREQVIAALLGAMAELDGLQPHFPSADERPIDAARRLSPALVVLDGEHHLAWDPDAMQAIQGRGIPILLISALRSQEELEQLGARHGVPALALPVRFCQFAEQVGRLLTPPVH